MLIRLLLGFCFLLSLLRELTARPTDNLPELLETSTTLKSNSSSSSQNKPKKLNDLPARLIKACLQHLDPVDLAAVACTSKSYIRLAQEAKEKKIEEYLKANPFEDSIRSFTGYKKFTENKVDPSIKDPIEIQRRTRLRREGIEEMIDLYACLNAGMTKEQFQSYLLILGEAIKREEPLLSPMENQFSRGQANKRMFLRHPFSFFYTRFIDDLRDDVQQHHLQEVASMLPIYLLSCAPGHLQAYIKIKKPLFKNVEEIERRFSIYYLSNIIYEDSLKVEKSLPFLLFTDFNESEVTKYNEKVTNAPYIMHTATHIFCRAIRPFLLQGLTAQSVSVIMSLLNFYNKEILEKRLPIIMNSIDKFLLDKTLTNPNKIVEIIENAMTTSEKYIESRIKIISNCLKLHLPNFTGNEKAFLVSHLIHCSVENTKALMESAEILMLNTLPQEQKNRGEILVHAYHNKKIKSRAQEIKTFKDAYFTSFIPIEDQLEMTKTLFVTRDFTFEALKSHFPALVGFSMEHFAIPYLLSKLSRLDPSLIEHISSYAKTHRYNLLKNITEDSHYTEVIDSTIKEIIEFIANNPHTAERNQVQKRALEVHLDKEEEREPQDNMDVKKQRTSYEPFTSPFYEDNVVGLEAFSEYGMGNEWSSLEDPAEWLDSSF